MSAMQAELKLKVSISSSTKHVQTWQENSLEKKMFGFASFPAAGHVKRPTTLPLLGHKK